MAATTVEPSDLLESEPYLSVAECAAVLSLSVKTVRKLMLTNDIPSVKVGGSYRIPSEELRERMSWR